jgi:membrane-bound lytic murein transglycosylase D
MLKIRYLCVWIVIFFLSICFSKATTLEEDTSPANAHGIHFCGETLPFHQQKVVSQFLKIVAQSKGRVAQVRHKANQYFKTIDPILKQNGIPADFRYLSIVESGLQAGVTSAKGAHGYWQFMPETARAMGLVVNAKTDERRHLVKSTQAACRYFKHLFAQLGSWTLVAAAYNAGPARLDAYMSRAESMSYYDLHLNQETGEYLYRILATKELFLRPERYNNTATLAKLPTNPPRTLPDTIEQQVTALFLPTTRVETDNDELTQAENKPKTNLAGTIVTQLHEQGASQKGQIWVFEVTASQVIENTLIEVGDRLYAEVEEVSAGMIYLRTSRIYSVHRHAFYSLPFAVIDSRGQIGVEINALVAKLPVVWKRL